MRLENQKGLHIRASAKFARIADSHDAEVTVTYNNMTVPGNSLMSLLMLTACYGAEIRVDVSGPEGEKAMNAFIELIKNRFGEEE